MENRFAIKIAEIDRELLNLKTAQKIPANIKGASYVFNVAMDGQGDVYRNGMYQYRITYGDGIQPILSEFYYEGTVWAQQPSGNTQRIFLYSHINGAPCTITSTRPIVSVSKVI